MMPGPSPKPRTVLLAGATGYLGRHLARELVARGHETRALVRDRHTATAAELAETELVKAQVTRPEELSGIMAGIDTVISTVGITRQRYGLTYDQVDFAANRNLLDEAVRASVASFLYVGVVNGPELRHTAMVAAKERFVEALQAAPIAHTVVRPSGFFSDLEAVATMAQRGHIWVLGDGNRQLNPIHGHDLANACLDVLGTGETEVTVGGPDTYTHRQIAQLAVDRVNPRARIHHVPAWAASPARRLLRWLTPRAVWGPAEFIIESSGHDMLGTPYGRHHLADHFDELADGSAA